MRTVTYLRLTMCISSSLPHTLAHFPFTPVCSTNLQKSTTVSSFKLYLDKHQGGRSGASVKRKGASSPLNHCLGLFQCEIHRIFIFAKSAHLLTPPPRHPPEGTTFSLEPREWMLMGVREENEGIICDVSAWPSGSMTPLQKTALTL